jgi:hypothetical protein
MKHARNRLGLALLFAAFCFFCVRFSPDGLGAVDKVALFAFGVLSGVNVGLYWGDRRITERTTLCQPEGSASNK